MQAALSNTITCHAVIREGIFAPSYKLYELGHWNLNINMYVQAYHDLSSYQEKILAHFFPIRVRDLMRTPDSEDDSCVCLTHDCDQRQVIVIM